MRLKGVFHGRVLQQPQTARPLSAPVQATIGAGSTLAMVKVAA